MGKGPWIRYQARCKAETEKAILVTIENEEYWIPKSQCGEYPEEGWFGTIEITDWIARQKGL